MSVPSSDAKAVVRAIEGLTAAVQRGAALAVPGRPLVDDAKALCVEARAALREQLRAAIDPVLADYPEHNRRDEHEQLLTQITDAALAVIHPKES